MHHEFIESTSGLRCKHVFLVNTLEMPKSKRDKRGNTIHNYLNTCEHHLCNMLPHEYAIKDKNQQSVMVSMLFAVGEMSAHKWSRRKSLVSLDF